MNPKIEARQFKKLMDAVERGKKLHHGPYTREQWEEGLGEEIEEMRDGNCGGIKCTECLDKRGCIEPLKAYRSEVQDVAVVAYRFGIFLDEMIAEKERELAEK